MTESPTSPPPRLAPAHMLARTALLLASLALLFPQLLDVPTHSAWSRFVLGLGTWRWVTWGACFVAMVVLRFSNLPKRGA